MLRAQHDDVRRLSAARRASATTSCVGSDLKLFSDQLLIRFFGAFKMPQVGDEDPKFTAVLFPQIAWAVWDATELSVGAFVFLGDRDTKFGDPAAGASEIFMKARFTY